MGGFRVLARLADEWINLGHDVSFLVPETSSQPYYLSKAKILVANRFGRIQSKNRLGEEKRKITVIDKALSIYFGLRKIGNQYDAIIADNSMIVCLLWAANCGDAKKVYYTQSDETETQEFWRVPIMNFVAKAALRLNLFQISNSPNYPPKKNGQEIPIVHPGVDISVFTPLTMKASSDNGDIVLGTVGRSEPYKGTRFVLDAFVKLHTIDPRFKLKIALGNVPARWVHPAAEIVKINSENELADYYRSLNILMVGCVGQHGAPHYPLIEAMACGIPVVHTDYFPGNSKNSWVVEPGDPDALAEGVLTALNSETREIKAMAALKFVRANLTWNIVASKMLQLL